MTARPEWDSLIKEYVALKRWVVIDRPYTQAGNQPPAAPAKIRIENLQEIAPEGLSFHRYDQQS
ncbi:MAG TPA: hypothetical protein VFY29_13920 [Terriglobia bacterium]|nr:hypothetical protein [Terriglobia bacterium]